jgi:hypothetical protein
MDKLEIKQGSFIQQTQYCIPVRGEDLKKSANQKQELLVVAMFVNGSGQNVQSLDRTAYRCFLPSFGSFGQTVSDWLTNMAATGNSCF